MTGPMISVPATQRAQQTLADQGVPQAAKQGESKFDAVLANKTQSTSGPDQAQATQQSQAVRQTEAVRPVEEVAGTEKPGLNLVSHVVHELEVGHLRLEKLIDASASGKTFSNAELLSLQASMYKYTLELDLTSKVVEKDTRVCPPGKIEHEDCRTIPCKVTCEEPQDTKR